MTATEAADDGLPLAVGDIAPSSGGYADLSCPFPEAQLRCSNSARTPLSQPLQPPDDARDGVRLTPGASDAALPEAHSESIRAAADLPHHFFMPAGRGSIAPSGNAEGLPFVP